jgi:hypothetical protein
MTTSPAVPGMVMGRQSREGGTVVQVLLEPAQFE